MELPPPVDDTGRPKKKLKRGAAPSPSVPRTSPHVDTCCPQKKPKCSAAPGPSVPRTSPAVDTSCPQKQPKCGAAPGPSVPARTSPPVDTSGPKNKPKCGAAPGRVVAAQTFVLLPPAVEDQDDEFACRLPVAGTARAAKKRLVALHVDESEDEFEEDGLVFPQDCCFLWYGSLSRRGFLSRGLHVAGVLGVVP